ncbi:MAG: SCO family protein [Thermomonas sp.]
MNHAIRKHLFAVAMLLFAGSVLSVGAFAAGKSAPLPANSLYQLSLPLTDQDGRLADWGTRRGKPQLVAMFYTSCKFICPLIVDSGKAIERQLDGNQQKKLGILLISMDPKRDNPATLKVVVDARKLDTARWTLASPPASEVRSVAGLLGIRYRLLADGGFNHSSALVLLDSDGRILARTEKMGSNPDPEFVAEVKKALR